MAGKLDGAPDPVAVLLSEGLFPSKSLLCRPSGTAAAAETQLAGAHIAARVHIDDAAENKTSRMTVTTAPQTCCRAQAQDLG